MTDTLQKRDLPVFYTAAFPSGRPILQTISGRRCFRDAKAGKPYTHAVSIKPDGSTIEKFVSKNATKDTLSVNYFTLIQDALGKYTLKSKTAKHNITKTAANADFVIKNNNNDNIVDIVDFLSKKAN